jgi:hypothetical protein
MSAKPAVKDTMGYWMVDGNHIYVPSESGVKVEHENIVSSDSGRDEAGYMHITWVRPDVRKVLLTYEKITADAVHEMIELMQGKTFSFTYYDNGIKTMDGYCGKNSYTIKSLRDRTNGGMYVSFSINVEEM